MDEFSKLKNKVYKHWNKFKTGKKKKKKGKIDFMLTLKAFDN